MLQVPSGQEVWYVKGAIDVVLRQCSVLPDGSPLTPVDKERYQDTAHDLGLKGLRGQRSKFIRCVLEGAIFIVVVAMARGAELGQLAFVGVVGMWDPPRPGVGMAVSTLLGGGVDVKMITGDARDTGEAIGMGFISEYIA